MHSMGCVCVAVKPIKPRKCSYADCALPLNNKYYLWQIGFLLIGLLALIGKAEDFNTFTIFTFIFPITVDLFYNEAAFIQNRYTHILYIVYLFLNLSILLICFLGFGNIVIDQSSRFEIAKSSMILPGASFSKMYLALLICADIVVPWMFYRGMPNQESMKLVNDIDERMGVGV